MIKIATTYDYFRKAGFSDLEAKREVALSELSCDYPCEYRSYDIVRVDDRYVANRRGFGSATEAVAYIDSLID